MRGSRRCRQQRDAFPLALPLLLLQMPREQAEAAIAEIEAAGGLLGIGFYQPSVTEPYTGVLALANGDRRDSGPLTQEPSQILRWQRAAIRSGYTCAVAIAIGSRGKTRYSPELRQILSYYEVSLLLLEPSGFRVPISL
ncbi:MAG: hypothetical protein HC918_08410 [Oscillatoriales cyanobacterium SM2_1_8]|nr:hypothetical protein [Oscillatoriales cyanobacterium SM2_1_8]